MAGLIVRVEGWRGKSDDGGALGAYAGDESCSGGRTWWVCRPCCEWFGYIV
jgi:hypothetical protein